jgi:hypothetical protein
MPQPRLPSQSYSSPRLVAALAVVTMLLTPGCAARRELAGYQVPESPRLDAAPWPRLADGPTHGRPPGPGPDTATGAIVAAELTASAREQAAEARRLAQPVLDVAPLRAEAEAVRAGRP